VDLSSRTAGINPGDPVRVREGSFRGMEGRVVDVLPGRGLVRVTLNVFGHPHTVQLEYWHLNPPPRLDEADWLECTRPDVLLAFLRGKATDRKFRLFAVACCRRFGAGLARDESRAAAAVAERLAEGQADAEEAARVRATLEAALNADAFADGIEYVAARTASAALDPDPVDAAEVAARVGVVGPAEETWPSRREQAELVREVFGNPFRAVTVDLGWLTANDGVALKLARTAYREQAFDRLPILADALEDAGCTNADVLGHCREAGVHVRGCWLLDHLLGKS
jgi:hypothetical protein